MSAIASSKLPTSDRPLIVDPGLAEAVEGLLAPLSGAKLERAQAAVRTVAASAVQGPFEALVAAYKRAIQRATGDKEG